MLHISGTQQHDSSCHLDQLLIFSTFRKFLKKYFAVTKISQGILQILANPVTQRCNFSRRIDFRQNHDDCAQQARACHLCAYSVQEPKIPKFHQNISAPMCLMSAFQNHNFDFFETLSMCFKQVVITSFTLDQLKKLS